MLIRGREKLTQDQKNQNELVKHMSKYRKGAQAERDLVNHLTAQKETVLVGRFAGSKCKGKIKVDVIHLTKSCLYLYQVKKFKNKSTKWGKEHKRFFAVKMPDNVFVFRRWESL